MAAASWSSELCLKSGQALAGHNRLTLTTTRTHHDAGEVDGGHSVEQQEERGVGEGAEAQQQARGRQQRRDVQVGEVGGPGGGLVLWGGAVEAGGEQAWLPGRRGNPQACTSDVCCSSGGPLPVA